MSEKILCPVCGSEKIKSSMTQTKRSFNANFSFSFFSPLNECLECQTRGDFENKMDDLYHAAFKEAAAIYAQKAFNELESFGIIESRFEWAFSLPARSTIKWKKGEINIEGISLLNLVVLYPFLVETAENGFDAKKAKEIYQKNQENKN